MGVINPIRYRGYYYDDETGLYYLESRYYDPETGRFISQDSIDFIVPNNLTGLNLYAYCGNNPVMRTDSAGTSWSSFWKSAGNFFINAGKVVGGGLIALAGAATTISSLPISLTIPGGGFATQVGFSTTMYGAFMVGSVFSSEINSDMQAIGWNPFNNDANAVANSNVVSFYKGVPVFRTDGSSGSFGCILLTRNGFVGSSGHYWSPEDILMHEWGHSVQQMTFGPIPYLINIGIPSAFIDNNDNAPWEITADILGGVNRSYSQDDIKQGWEYFWWGRIIGPFWWW